MPRISKKNLRWIGHHGLDEPRLMSLQQQDPVTGCHNWTGPRNNAGYGMFGVRWHPNSGRNTPNGMMSAHRAAWMLEHGVSVPPNMEVQHSCLNRLCVNPDHLSIGDHHSKMLHMISEGRHGFQLNPNWNRQDRTHWHRHYDGSRKYTEEEIQWVRAASVDDIMQRYNITRKQAQVRRSMFRAGYRWLPFDREGTRIPRGRPPGRKCC